MKVFTTMLLVFTSLVAAAPLLGQGSANCFLWDFESKYATIPPYEDVEKTTATPTVTITINPADTLGKISKYMFGNAVAVWVGQDQNNPVLVGHLQKLSPTLIRFPGGSWSNLYFWDGKPVAVPSSIYIASDGHYETLKLGPSQKPTCDRYLDMRDQLGAQGLITINYGYARYGLSEKPAEQAAHYAANWVRYDGGRTKFWEIGNENAGPWEGGWQIDTTKNRDGQPKIITGEIYGRHFKIFADSMRAAAAELDETIYIGGQILHYDASSSWNVADRKWNEAFFREAGDAVDFYVIHNYFGNSTTSIKNQIDVARNDIGRNITFIRQDIINKQAFSKPIAITEWNCGGPDLAKTSIANGMQAVVLICEMIKYKFGMSARWLVANWESDGMFYFGNNPTIPRWNPRPDFYYLYYLQRFTGDRTVSSAVNGSGDVLAYASRFSSGHAGIVVVNKGTAEQVIKIAPTDYGVGEKFYIYSLTGVDNSQWPQGVFVNEEGPTGQAWGPLDGLENIPARAYPIGDVIEFISPARSVQYILIEPGNHFLSVKNENQPGPADQYVLQQNYPNPFNPMTTISYSLPRTSIVTLKLYDVLGHEIATLVHHENKIAGNYKVSYDARNLSSGVYLCRLHAENFAEMKTIKMLLIK